MSRPMTSELESVTAECHGCDWTADARNALAAAARHYDATGHPVTSRVLRVVHYGNAADVARAREAAGQTAMNVGADR